MTPAPTPRPIGRLAREPFRAICPTAIAAIALILAGWLGGELGEASEPNSLVAVQVDGIPFEIPPGTSWELAAGPDLCTWPIVATWDDDGNLVVAESVWNRESVHQQLESRPHRIVRLTDSDGDGRFDGRQVVAEGLSFPEGILCMGRDMLVAAPPQIWRLTDADGDGACESREVWFDGKTLTHCANDLHGPWLGPDGWIYWSKSAFAEQSHELLSGKVFTSSASHLYRRHPSGGPIEPVMTGGMDNLVDIAWLPNGERFFCATFLHHPRHAFRDGIGHAQYGAVFGKPHAVLDGHPRTGPLMEPLVELGPAAPAGLLSVSSLTSAARSLLVDPVGGVRPDPLAYLLCAQFNLHQVSLHGLRDSREQAGYSADSAVLLRSPQIDFHPVDVLLDRDGSLVVVDTGGWYDLCCPSSGTDQRVALGGIYRLRGATLPEVSDVSGLAKSLVEDPSNPKAWAEVLQRARSELDDVRQSALALISLYRWEPARPFLVDGLSSSDAKTLRLSVEGLGRLGLRAEETIALFALHPRFAQDRVLEHAVAYALIEGASEELLRSHLLAPAPWEASLAAWVLDQTRALNTDDTATICTLAASPRSDVAVPARQILARHPDWAESAIAWLGQKFSDADDESSGPLIEIAAAWLDQPPVRRWVQDQLGGLAEADERHRERLLALLGRFRGRELPEGWGEPLAAWLAECSEGEGMSWSESLASLGWGPAASVASTVLRRRIEPLHAGSPAKWLIWARLLPRDEVLSEGHQRVLVQSMASGEASTRRLARQAWERVRLSDPEAIDAAVEALDRAGPLDMPGWLAGLLRVESPELDRNLLERLPRLNAAKSLDAESIVSLMRGRSDGAIAQWREALNSLQRPPEEIQRGVDRWMRELPPGDKAHGYQVFRSAKAGCSACHTIGYVGGNIGPVLSQIGKTRSRRDLLEAILYPSARLEQSYRSTKFRTTDGDVVVGLVVDENAQAIEVQVAADRRVRLVREEIEAQEPSAVSIMPAGLDQQLTPQELADLIAFLESSQ